jgi:hypothetical protein
MLRLLSNLNLCTRYDVEASAGLVASGVTGTWVAQAADALDMPAADAYAVGPVWTESKRDGTAGWTPDQGFTGNLTVLYGKHRAQTDQFAGTPAAGAALAVNAAGKLAVSATGITVAYCTKASHSISHLGSSHTVIE